MSSCKLSCHDVAQYFLAQMDEDAGDLISNLKLQKLVYYAQGFALALHGRPLFRERVEAWTHGAPVVPELYVEDAHPSHGEVGSRCTFFFQLRGIIFVSLIG